MKTRQLMQLQTFSRTVLKKNEQIYIIILLIMTAVRICAQESFASVSLSDNRIKILLRLTGMSPRSILTPVQENQTAEITFSIRLYQKEKESNPFRAVLVKEVSKIQWGQWMPVIQRYVVQSDNGSVYFTNEQTFVVAFLSQRFNLSFLPKQKESYYILTRIQLKTLKFLPPFTILEPFFRNYYKTTPWVQTELTG